MAYLLIKYLFLKYQLLKSKFQSMRLWGFVTSKETLNWLFNTDCFDQLPKKYLTSVQNNL